MSSEASGFRNILVATDFSPHSDFALQRGVQLAGLCRSNLTLSHIITNVRETMERMDQAELHELVAGDVEKFHAALCRESNQMLEQLAEPLRGELSVQCRTRPGVAYLQTIHVVQEDRNDLVVIGTRGRSAVARFLLGSTAQRLVRHCPTPVWVAKSAPALKLQKIVVAVDFSSTSERALEVAANLAREAAAELVVLHVLDGITTLEMLAWGGGLPVPSNSAIRRQAKANMAKFVDKHCAGIAKLTTRIATGEPWRTITGLARRTKADVTVVGSLGRTGLAGVMIGNTAEKVLNASTTDVLVVKPADYQSWVLPAFQA